MTDCKISKTLEEEELFSPTCIDAAKDLVAAAKTAIAIRDMTTLKALVKRIYGDLQTIEATCVNEEESLSKLKYVTPEIFDHTEDLYTLTCIDSFSKVVGKFVNLLADYFHDKSDWNTFAKNAQDILPMITKAFSDCGEQTQEEEMEEEEEEEELVGYLCQSAGSNLVSLAK